MANGARPSATVSDTQEGMCTFRAYAPKRASIAPTHSHWPKYQAWALNSFWEEL